MRGYIALIITLLFAACVQSDRDLFYGAVEVDGHLLCERIRNQSLKDACYRGVAEKRDPDSV